MPLPSGKDPTIAIGFFAIANESDCYRATKVRP